MFTVLLTFSDNKDLASQHMDEHKAWLQRGFDDGVFLLSGSMAGGAGGAIVANTVERAELDERIAADPFVEHRVVSAQVIEFKPSMADQRLAFLLDQP